MITARQFEEGMLEIRENYWAHRDSARMYDEACKLFSDTLDTLGYSAGTKVYKEMRDADKRNNLYS